MTEITNKISNLKNKLGSETLSLLQEVLNGVTSVNGITGAVTLDGTNTNSTYRSVQASINQNLTSINDELGDLTTLQNPAHTDIVAALNDLNTRVIALEGARKKKKVTNDTKY